MDLQFDKRILGRSFNQKIKEMSEQRKYIKLKIIVEEVNIKGLGMKQLVCLLFLRPLMLIKIERTF